MKHYIGIDIGSTCTKTAVINENKEIVSCFVQPTGWSSLDTAENVREKLMELGHDVADTPCVATGYGRVSVPFAHKSVTEISCHAKGAMLLQSSEDLTVIDIGGQDTKIILVEKAQVKDFIMNDKCSAGTGRFLEIMANTLAVRPEELCTLAAQGGGTSISSMCTVFAESEVVSLIGRGESKENIAFAVIDSIVKKVAAQARRLDRGSGSLCLTGGLCEFDYIREALGKELHRPISSDPKGRYAGALGAALSAMQIKNFKAQGG